MVCDILDWRCIIVNEIIGTPVLTGVVLAIIYFIFAAKIRMGFDATIFLSLPILLLVGYAVVGFTAIYAFGAVLAGILLATALNRMIK